MSEDNSYHTRKLLSFFSDLDADFLRKFWKIFGRCLQKFNLRVHKLFVEIHIFRGKFLFLFLLLAFGQKKDFWKKAARLYKLYSTCPKKFSGKSFRLIRSFFQRYFQTLGDLLSEIWQTFVQQAVKLALHLSKRFWWRETRSLRKKMIEFYCSDFWTFCEKLWQGCQNCILRARRIILKYSNFLKRKQFFIVFPVFLSECSSRFWREFWARLSKMLHTCRREFVWK